MILIKEIESLEGKIDILNMNVLPTNNSIIPSEYNIDGSTYKKTIVLNNVLDNKIDEIVPNKDRYNDNTVNFRYICIKKEHFDVNMVYLKYTNLKKEKYIEIIYKSPSIYLDGLFFKTPPLNISQILVFTKDKIPYTSMITTILDRIANVEFINMLKSIDTFVFNYIARQSKDINIKMHEDENHHLNYEPILKPYYQTNKQNDANTHLQYATITAWNTSSSSKWLGNYTLNFKSYLERSILENLKKSIRENHSSNTEKKYVITFNISNIYFSNKALTPLIKCNKCEEVI